ncbi:MAG: peptidylprolyl isomerase [Caldilineaceae bacterium]
MQSLHRSVHQTVLRERQRFYWDGSCHPCRRIDSNDATFGHAPITATETQTGAAATAAEGTTAAVAVTGTTSVTTTTGVTATAVLTGSDALTGTNTVADSIDSAVTPPEPVERTDAEARAFAEELRQRILAGEDFATLAEQYSDDTGSGANGGDLGWFGHGAMVSQFDEAAFNLEIGEISEPIKTQFGYHIIEVLEKDENRPKDESTLTQERNQAFDQWLQEKKATMDIERPVDLNARLPRDIR